MVNEAFPILVSFLGSCLLMIRMWPRASFSPRELRIFPTVSIIVPARNEEGNLRPLLESLAGIDYPAYEVILVDDQSTDHTLDVATGFQKSFPSLKIIRGRDRPPKWGGKQWACHQGGEAASASGSYLLFTDADTVHERDSLRIALSFMQVHQLDFMTALPFHSGKSLWEKLLGPFHILLLSITAPYAKPRVGRVFAIGQYLVFTRRGYNAIGGHAAVRDRFVEDVPMACLALKKGLNFKVLAHPRVFQVRMYETFTDFICGWRRNFRAGFQESRLIAPLEVTLMICGMTGGGQVHSLPAWALAAVTALFLALRQRSLGYFSILGVFLLPFSLLTFCGISLLSVWDQARGAELKWKNRSYLSQQG